VVGHHLDLDDLHADLSDYLGDDRLQPRVDATDQHPTAVLRAPDQVVFGRIHRLLVEW
jgi:hypothetical protein